MVAIKKKVIKLLNILIECIHFALCCIDKSSNLYYFIMFLYLFNCVHLFYNEAVHDQS